MALYTTLVFAEARSVTKYPLSWLRSASGYVGGLLSLDLRIKEYLAPSLWDPGFKSQS